MGKCNFVMENELLNRLHGHGDSQEIIRSEERGRVSGCVRPHPHIHAVFFPAFFPKRNLIFVVNSTRLLRLLLPVGRALIRIGRTVSLKQTSHLFVSVLMHRFNPLSLWENIATRMQPNLVCLEIGDGRSSRNVLVYDVPK